MQIFFLFIRLCYFSVKWIELEQYLNKENIEKSAFLDEQKKIIAFFYENTWAVIR